MIELDGSDGGGQLVRSALTLAAATGTAFEMEDIRGSRPTPGLRHQHLAAVEAVGTLCEADIDGADIGSERLRFEPRSLSHGQVTVDAGTAASTTLVCDAVLPLALVSDGPIDLTVRGGTDVKWSPPLDYHRLVKFPLLRRLGLRASIDLDRRGFYPAGGGEVTLRLAPSSLAPIELTTAEPVESARVYSTATEGLADANVAERQMTAAVERLAERAVPVVERSTTYVDADSPGSAVVVRLDRGTVTTGADALGEPGTPAEEVGEAAAERALEVVDSTAPVDRHLADQLIVFLALSGGEIAVPAVTDHVASNASLMAAFDRPVRIEEGDPVTLRRSP